MKFFSRLHLKAVLLIFLVLGDESLRVVRAVQSERSTYVFFQNLLFNSKILNFSLLSLVIHLYQHSLTSYSLDKHLSLVMHIFDSHTQSDRVRAIDVRFESLLGSKKISQNYMFGFSY